MTCTIAWYRSPALAAVPLIAAVACGPGSSERIPDRDPHFSDAQPTTCQSPAHLSNYGAGSRSGPATVVPVVWDGWNGATSTVRDQVDDVYGMIAASNYYKWLQNEYGAPILGQVPHVWWNSSWAPGDHQQSEIEHDLDQAIRSGALPTPPNAIYAIHLGQGITITTSNGEHTCADFFAYNNTYTTFDINGGYEAHYYLLIPDPQTCNVGFNGTTTIMSHELAENITDPANLGWEDRSQPASCHGAQIGDLCLNEQTTIESNLSYSIGAQTFHSLTVQKLWSNAMNACVTEDASTTPTFTGLSPGQGGIGTAVTITGTNFDGPPLVLFGSDGVPANVSCSSSTQCTAIVPEGNPGRAPVLITIDSTTFTSAFTYVPPPACTYAFNDDPEDQECNGALTVTCPALYSDFLNGTSLAAPVTIYKVSGPSGTPTPFWQVNYSFVAPNWPKVTDPAGTTDYFVACASGPPGDCDPVVPVQVTQFPCVPGNNPCTPYTCASYAGHCGVLPDGCGGSLSCPTCPTGTSCDDNLCVAPSTCPAPPKRCPGGTAWDSVACACTCVSVKCQGGN